MCNSGSPWQIAATRCLLGLGLLDVAVSPFQSHTIDEEQRVLDVQPVRRPFQPTICHIPDTSAPPLLTCGRTQTDSGILIKMIMSSEFIIMSSEFSQTSQS